MAYSNSFWPLIILAIIAIIILKVIARKLRIPYSWKFLVVVFILFVVITFPFSVFTMLPMVVSIIASIVIIILIYYYRKKIFTKKITGWLRK